MGIAAQQGQSRDWNLGWSPKLCPVVVCCSLPWCFHGKLQCPSLLGTAWELQLAGTGEDSVQMPSSAS